MLNIVERSTATEHFLVDNYAERAANELELKLNTTPDTVTLPASSEENTAETTKAPDKYK